MSGGWKRIAAMAAAAAMGWASGALAQEAAGDWHGTLTGPGGGQLRIGLTVKAKTGGGYEGALQSPDQTPIDLPLDEVKVDAGKLSFSLAAIGGAYEGKWDEARHAWVGEWRQGLNLPLVLSAGKP
jgi:hypothetical protein